MTIASISEFRKNIKAYTDKVDSDQQPLIITRADDPSVVVLPLSIYESYQETDYLTASPKNVEHLRTSISQLKSGRTKPHEL